MKSIVLGVAAMLAAATLAAAETQKKDVDIKAPDGVNLKGTYYSSGTPGPAILLLHQCNMDRRAWDGLAADLATAGISVLTIDFRAFGESGGDRMPFRELSQTVIPQKFPGDVEAAYAFLRAQPGVDRTRVAAGGASCGVTQSSALAARRPEITTLMVLSGTASDETKAYIAKTPALAVFGAAAEEDRNAAAGIKAIVDASKNAKSVLKMYAGAEHGVPMFARNPELQPMIVSWLKTQLLSKNPTTR
jgi:dienelactone hydrolase